MVAENGRVVACWFKELRAVEVPAEVVGEVDILALEFAEGEWEVEVLLIEERHFHSHFECGACADVCIYVVPLMVSHH